MKDIGKLLSETIYLTMLATVPYEFRITCVPGIVDEEDVRSIGETLKGAEKCCLQQFRSQITYNESFREVVPYKKEKLAKFREILLGYVKTVDIRGI
jgi:pyruvate formate lyase activating enzyme